MTSCPHDTCSGLFVGHRVLFGGVYGSANSLTHEAVRDWEARFAPLLAERLRAQRRGRGGVSWYADETYGKVQGRWCYLSRAIDREGNLLDSMLSSSPYANTDAKPSPVSTSPKCH